MCGRYAASRRPEDLVEEFEVDATDGDGPGEDPRPAEPDYNVAPTKTAPVVLERVPRPISGATDRLREGPPPDDPESDDLAADDLAAGGGAPGGVEPVAAVRWLRLLRWGLVPSWAKDRSVGSRLINARADTLLDKPAFRRAAVARRCLVPVDGWYEWQPSPTERDAKGRPRKQPFFLGPRDGPGLALAGVYEFWRDPALHVDDPAAWVTTYAVVTTQAEPALRAIHDRMPLVLPRDRWDAWLDPDLRDPELVRELLRPPPEGGILAVPVSTRVNAVANNGPRLREPVPIKHLRGVVDPETGELIGAGETPLF